MTKRALILAILLAAMVPAPLQAQETAPVASPADPASLIGQLKPATGLTAHFEQERLISALSRPLKSSGTLTIAADGAILWQQEVPYPATTRFSEAGVTELDEDGNPAETIENPMMTALGRAFMGLFRGETAGLAQYFTVTLTREAGSGWLLKLVPSDPVLAKAIREIDVRGTDVVQGIDIFETAEGNASHIRFSDHRWDTHP